MTINLLDIGFAAVLVLFTVRGFIRGIVKEITGLLGILLAFILAGKYYHQATPYILPYLKNNTWADVLAYIGVFTGTTAVAAILGAILRKYINMTLVPGFDQIMGAVVGTGKGLLACAIALALLAKFDPASPLVTESALASYVGQVTAFAQSLLPAFL